MTSGLSQPDSPTGLDQHRLSRRRLLGAGVAAGFAAGGLQSHLSRLLAAASVPPRSVPPKPRGAQAFVSRPDLKPPKVAITGASAFAKEKAAPHYIFVAPHGFGVTGAIPGGAQSGAMILDVFGNLVWFSPSSASLAVFNFTPQTYRGKPVLSWWEGKGGSFFGRGSYRVIDASYRTIASVAGGGSLRGDLHEFVITPEGTGLFDAYDETKSGSQTVLEGVALEVDIATGDLVYEWGSLGAGRVGLSESYVPPSGASSPWDYFHINSVDLWPGPERDLLISGRNTCAIYRVSRHTKEIVWRLGGKRSDFPLTDRTRFWWQHDARALNDGSGLSLYDDASDPVERANGDPQSRGMVLTFHPSNKSVSLRNEFLHTDTPASGNEAGFMGNVQSLPTGGHFVGWGGLMPYFSAFGPSGSAVEAPLVLDGRFPDGCYSYRTYAADWVGKPPVDELALTVKAARGGSEIGRPSPAGTAPPTWRRGLSWPARRRTN